MSCVRTWVRDDHGYIAESHVQIVEQGMNSKKRVHLTHPREHQHIPALVRFVIDRLRERCGRAYLRQLLKLAGCAMFCFLHRNRLEDSALLAYVEKDVVEVARNDAIRLVARFRFAFKGGEESPCLHFEDGVVAEGEKAYLVSDALVFQKVGIEKMSPKCFAAMREIGLRTGSSGMLGNDVARGRLLPARRFCPLLWCNR